MRAPSRQFRGNARCAQNRHETKSRSCNFRKTLLYEDDRWCEPQHCIEKNPPDSFQLCRL